MTAYKHISIYITRISVRKSISFWNQFTSLSDRFHMQRNCYHFDTQIFWDVYITNHDSFASDIKGNLGFYSAKDTIICTLTSVYYLPDPVMMHSWEVSMSTPFYRWGNKGCERAPVQAALNPHWILPLRKAWQIWFQFLYLNHLRLERIYVQQNTKNPEKYLKLFPISLQTV